MNIDNDTGLINKIKLGNRKAFDRLLKKYKEPLFGFLFHLTGSKQDAEDLFQETFIRIIHNINSYSHRNKFKSWIFKIAHNCFREKERKKKYDTIENRQSWEERYLNSDAKRLPDKIIEHKEFMEYYKKALGKLSTDLKTVFLMRVQSELSFKEIAEILGCSINTALGRMHYALMQLRKEIIHQSEGKKV
jgi:RNA polymerase sigma-70 factor (ECF subfamily)